MAVSIRKTVHEKLITDLKALVFIGTSTKCFDKVEKFLVDIPTDGLVCEVLSYGAVAQQDGISFDSRVLQFRALVYESIEAQTSQSAIDVIVNRLSDLEDAVLDYLEQAPNAIGASLSGIQVYDIKDISVQDTIIQDSNGNNLVKAIDFSVYIKIDVQAL